MQFPELKKDVAEFVETIFMNGIGTKADRLVLTIDGDNGPRDLGGWSRAAIADKIFEFVGKRIAALETFAQSALQSRTEGEERFSESVGVIAEMETRNDLLTSVLEIGLNNVRLAKEFGIDIGQGWLRFARAAELANAPDFDWVSTTEMRKTWPLFDEATRDAVIQLIKNECSKFPDVAEDQCPACRFAFGFKVPS